MTASSSTVKPSGVMGNEVVGAAIRDVAGEDESLWGICQERAVEAAEAYARLADRAGVAREEKAMQQIAVHAVRTLESKHGHKYDPLGVMKNWLGHENVPADLRFSWEHGAPAPQNDSAPAIPEITQERGAELLQAQNTMAVADRVAMDSYDVIKAVGRIEGLEFTRRVGEIATAQIFIEVRSGKKYRGLPYTDQDGVTRHVGDFEEFCRVFLGKSYNRCLELANNLHILGPDLYESAERIGFKARDYAALKALPESEQEIVKTALAAESRDQVLDILQDLAARHQSERQAAKKQAEDMQADLDARDKLLADKGERLDKVSMELATLKSLPPNKREALRLEQEQEAAKKLTTAVMEAQAAINGFLGQLAEIKAAEVSLYTKQHADQTASWFCQQVQLALQENGIQADMAEIVLPEWMRETAKQSPVDQEGR